ncbi:MAG: hypothetical protein Q9209_004958 [Squamulea sp. 1 TL-2023]
MADTTRQLEEDDCITPRQSTTISLQYPSLPVTGTPDSWLSRSLLVSMASIQDEGSVRSNDDTTSSLGDSAYDFIDDNSFATTDDEDLGLTGRSSSQGRNTHKGPPNQDSERTLHPTSTHPNPSHRLKQDDMQSSVYSSTSEEDTFCRESSETLQQRAPIQQMPPSIKFHDIHHGEGAFLLDTASAPKNNAVTVRQHMLDHSLSLEGPYRLLYVGDVAARERIVAKIGAALASTIKDESPRPLRYNVVPMPSSDDPDCFSEPVLLDWSGHEIVVYQCINASFNRKDNGHETIKLTMDGDADVQSVWDGSKFDLTEGWEVPDVAVFYLSQGDNLSAKQTRRLARSFMARHEIPAIVISERPTWERPAEAITIERLTPHICLQTKSGTTSSSSVVKRLPIDLSTFMRLDALQLNHNLAYLALARGTPRPINGDQRSVKSGGRRNFSKGLNFQPTWDSILGYLGPARPRASLLLNLLAAVSILVAARFMSFQFGPLQGPSIDHGLDINMNCSPALTPLSSAMATSVPSLKSKPTMLRSLSSESPAKLELHQRLPVGKSHTDLATLLESNTLTINKSEKFQAHVLGDTHIVLRPPHWFTRLKRTPKLNIKITQGDRILKHQMSTIFDGMYALELPIDEAHGLINISVWTDSRPKIHENLQTDFGNSWLRAAGWKRAVNALSGSFRQDLVLVQTSISAVLTRSDTELHYLVQKTLGKADQLKAETQKIRKVSMDRMANAMNHILASTKCASLNLAKCLKQRKESVSRRVSFETEELRRDILSYVFDKARLARIYAEATPTAYRIHLRNTQKKALRVWWSLTGLPQQRPVNVAGKGRSRSGGGGRLKKPAAGK